MDRRAADRLPAEARVGFDSPQGSIASQLRDISQSGCRLAIGSAGLTVGMPITIQLVDSISIHGIVRWVEGEEAGVEVTIRIHETMMQVLVAGADDVSFVTSRRRMQWLDNFGRALPLLGGGRGGREAKTGSKG